MMQSLKMDNTLSIILPCRNEEKNIARCLQSVIEATKELGSVEIILVDGASTDKTIEIAKKFPVNIVQLDRSWVQSAAAGRFIGTLRAQGEYIWFVDADIRLVEGFAEKAIKYLNEHRECAAIAGIGDEIYLSNGNEIAGETRNVYRRDTKKTAEVEYLGASAMFRKKALEEVGYFNPYLFAHEEWEVCQRLRHKKLEIISLPIKMAVHRTHPIESRKVFIKQLENRRFFATGQLLRMALARRISFFNLARFQTKQISIFLLAILLVLMNIYAIFYRLGVIFPITLFIVLSFYFYLLINKKSMYRGSESFLKWLKILFYIFIGCMRLPKDSRNYPTDVKIIQNMESFQ